MFIKDGSWIDGRMGSIGCLLLICFFSVKKLVSRCVDGSHHDIIGVETWLFF